jgi:hypothetical protein
MSASSRYSVFYRHGGVNRKFKVKVLTYSTDITGKPLETISYNNLIINCYDIDTFNISIRSNNDGNNKKREAIIACIINNTIPNNYYKYSVKWDNLKKQLDLYIQKLCEIKNIKSINSRECILKAGRKYHYDFELIINKTFVFKVEFKFNAGCVSDTPQFVSPMKPSQYLEENYVEYYYENHLPNLLQEFELKMPPKEEYINKIHSNKPKCVSLLQGKYYKGCKKSSQYTANEDHIKFYNRSNEVSKKSIREFITKYDIKKEKLSEYLLKTQQDKFYMLYKDGRIFSETVNQDNYIIISCIKEPNKYRYVAKTKTGVKMKILLRWKNGNGIAFPAFQIS